jgi:hypothetical protein
MDQIALWLGWILVWMLGVAVVGALFSDKASASGPGYIPFVAGCGFLVGLFLLTAWMRALSALVIAFGVVPIGAACAIVAGVAAFHALRVRSDWMQRSRWIAALHRRDLPDTSRVLWFAILGWLALRFVLLLLEVLRQPLYPWDAWTQWATKAKVWYALKTMAPFVDAAQWLAAPGAAVYVDAAPNYPATVPLMQVWSATLLGRWDDALVNLPWWLMGVAFGLALYGFLRKISLGPVAALVGAWLVLSLPILDTHIALAGYADLPMAAYFTTTALAALTFARTRSWRDLALALVLALACITVKNPGKIWVATLVPALIVAMVPKYGLRIVAAMFAAVGVLAVVLTRTGMTVLGYHLELQFDMPWQGLYDAYFAYANWHLLFYAAVLVAAIGWRYVLSPGIAPLTVLVLTGLAFLMFGFGFTNARLWVEDQSTVNRATLHLAPLIVVWIVLVYRAWSDAWSRRADVARPAPAIATEEGLPTAGPAAT